MTTMKATPPTNPDSSGVAPENPSYPYGLRIMLEEAQIAALNLDLSALKLDAELDLRARVCVVGLNETPGEREGQGRSLSLQITDLELTHDAEKSRDAVAKRLYRHGTKQ